MKTSIWWRIKNWIYPAIFGLLVLITHSFWGELGVDCYHWAKEKFIPTQVTVRILNCTLYRTDEIKYPECELSLLLDNSNEISQSIRPISITLFKPELSVKFPLDNPAITIEPHSYKPQRIKISDKSLDRALRIPQSPDYANVAFVYSIVSSSRICSCAYSDKQVTKCVYWQTPRFDWFVQAADLGLSQYSASGSIYYHEEIDSRPISGSSKVLEEPLDMFFSPNDVAQVNQAAILQALFQICFTQSAYVNLSDLGFSKKKYGGLYVGLLKSSGLKQGTYPSQILGKMNDYSEYDLLGINIDRDFSKVTEFIYYSFDPRHLNDNFQVLQDNSKIYVNVIYDDSVGMAAVKETFLKRGIRGTFSWTKSASQNSESSLKNFIRTMIEFTPSDHYGNLVSQINSSVDNINRVVLSDGILVFAPECGAMDSRLQLLNEIKQTIGDKPTFVFPYSSGPFRNINPFAQFSDIFYIWTNFNRDGSLSLLDSIAVYQ